MSCDQAPKGGLPARTDIIAGRAVFRETCAVTHKDVMSNMVASYLLCKDMNRDAKLRGMGGLYQ